MPRSLSRSDPIHITSLSGQGRQAIFCNYVRVEDMDQDATETKRRPYSSINMILMVDKEDFIVSRDSKRLTPMHVCK